MMTQVFGRDTREHWLWFGCRVISSGLSFKDRVRRITLPQLYELHTNTNDKGLVVTMILYSAGLLASIANLLDLVVC